MATRVTTLSELQEVIAKDFPGVEITYDLSRDGYTVTRDEKAAFVTGPAISGAPDILELFARRIAKELV